MNCLDGFYFNDKLSTNQEIESRIADYLAFELQNNRLLPLIRNVSQIELDGERLFIYRFQKSRPKNSMNFNSSTDNLMR